MYFKFNGKDSRDYGITVTTQPVISTPQHRTWTTFIDGYDGARSSHLGFHPYEISFEIAVEDERNIDRILQWLQGEGKFIRSDFPDRYINVYMQSEIKLSYLVEWLYTGTITMWAHDPFWYAVKDEWIGPYIENDLHRGWRSFYAYDMAEFEGGTHAPKDIFEKGYTRNLFINTGTWEGYKFLSTTGNENDYKIGRENLIVTPSKKGDFQWDASFTKQMSLEKDYEYTLSMEVKSSKKEKIKFKWEILYESLEWEEEVGPEWTKVNLTYNHPIFTIINPEPSEYDKYRISLDGLTPGTTYTVRRVKLNYGRPSQWTKAWEDYPKRMRTVPIINGTFFEVEDLEEDIVEVRAYGDHGVRLHTKQDGLLAADINNLRGLITVKNKALDTVIIPGGTGEVFEIPTYGGLDVSTRDNQMVFRGPEPLLVGSIKNINEEKEKALKPYIDKNNLIEGGP